MSVPSGDPIAVFSRSGRRSGRENLILYESVLEVRKTVWGFPKPVACKPRVFDLHNLSGHYRCWDGSLVSGALLLALAAGLVLAPTLWLCLHLWDIQGYLDYETRLLIGLSAFTVVLVGYLVVKGACTKFCTYFFAGKPPLVFGAFAPDAKALHAFALLLARQINLVHSGRTARAGVLEDGANQVYTAG